MLDLTIALVAEWEQTQPKSCGKGLPKDWRLLQQPIDGLCFGVTCSKISMDDILECPHTFGKMLYVSIYEGTLESGTLIIAKDVLNPLSQSQCPLNFIFSFFGSSFHLLPWLHCPSSVPLSFFLSFSDILYDFDPAIAAFMFQRLSETCLFFSDALNSPKKNMCSPPSNGRSKGQQ